MNTQELSKLDVKLCIIKGDENNTKRIPVTLTIKELLTISREQANKVGIMKKTPISLSYIDSENELIKVEDDSDVQMAYAVALTTDGKIKFQINYNTYT